MVVGDAASACRAGRAASSGRRSAARRAPRRTRRSRNIRGSRSSSPTEELCELLMGGPRAPGCASSTTLPRRRAGARSASPLRRAGDAPAASPIRASRTGARPDQNGWALAAATQAPGAPSGWRRTATPTVRRGGLGGRPSPREALALLVDHRPTRACAASSSSRRGLPPRASRRATGCAWSAWDRLRPLSAPRRRAPSAGDESEVYRAVRPRRTGVMAAPGRAGGDARSSATRCVPSRVGSVGGVGRTALRPREAGPRATRGRAARALRRRGGTAAEAVTAASRFADGGFVMWRA
jgi:hypothetical protein